MAIADNVGMVYGDGSGTNAGTGNSNLVNNYTFFYNRVVQTEATQNLIYAKLFMSKVLPTKNGKIFKFKRRKKILPWRAADQDAASWLEGARDLTNIGWTVDGTEGAITDPTTGDIGAGFITLAEGAGRVNELAVTNETYQGTMQRIGGFIPFTDEVEIFSEEGKREVAGFGQELGTFIGNAVDDYFQSVAINSIQNEYHVGITTSILDDMTQAGGQLSSANALTATESITSVMFQDGVKPTRKMLTGSTNVDTKVVGSTYVKIVHPDIAYHYKTAGKADGWFIAVEEYAASLKAAGASLMDNEIGSVGDTRVVVGPRAMFKTNANATPAKCYPSIILGEDAFVSIALQGENAVKTRVIDPSVKENGNPYGTQGLISAQTWIGGRTYNEDASWIMWETSSKND